MHGSITPKYEVLQGEEQTEAGCLCAVGSLSRRDARAESESNLHTASAPTIPAVRSMGIAKTVHKS